jgi:methionyl-tRNA synthetase
MDETTSIDIESRNRAWFNRHITWYLGDRQEARRHASVLVLAELARHASVFVYPYVDTILNQIWGTLREPKVRFEKTQQIISPSLPVIG